MALPRWLKSQSERLKNLSDEVYADAQKLPDLERLVREVEPDITQWRGRAKHDLLNAYELALSVLARRWIQDRDWTSAKDPAEKLKARQSAYIRDVVMEAVTVLRHLGGMEEQKKIKMLSAGCDFLRALAEGEVVKSALDDGREELKHLALEIPDGVHPENETKS